LGLLTLNHSLLLVKNVLHLLNLVLGGNFLVYDTVIPVLRLHTLLLPVPGILLIGECILEVGHFLFSSDGLLLSLSIEVSLVILFLHQSKRFLHLKDLHFQALTPHFAGKLVVKSIPVQVFLTVNPSENSLP
jgi:hypothetical protein